MSRETAVRTPGPYVVLNIPGIAAGTRGQAFPASGHDDPDSCEEGAWLFLPDGEEAAAYCDPAALALATKDQP